MEPGKRCWSDDLGKLILRLAIGGLLLFHGVDKIMHGIEPIKAAVKGNNTPEFVAYGVYLGEVLGPILVIVGLWTRLGALMIAVNMIVALAMVHRGDFGSLSPMGGAWALELQGLFLFGALAILFMGAGRISISGARQRAAATGQATADTKAM